MWFRTSISSAKSVVALAVNANSSAAAAARNSGARAANSRRLRSASSGMRPLVRRAMRLERVGVSDEFLIDRMARDRDTVADHDQAAARARDGHVQAPQVAEEP